jgi:hypothetical protein
MGPRPEELDATAQFQLRRELFKPLAFRPISDDYKLAGILGRLNLSHRPKQYGCTFLLNKSAHVDNQAGLTTEAWL